MENAATVSVKKIQSLQKIMVNKKFWIHVEIIAYILIYICYYTECDTEWVNRGDTVIHFLGMENKSSTYMYTH